MSFTQLFTDNFTRANASSFGNGWVDPGSKGSIVSNTGSIATSSNSYNGSGIVYRPTSDGNPRDGQAVFVLDAGTSTTANPYVVARLQPSASNATGYFLGYGGGSISVGTIVNGTIAFIGSGVALSPAYNNAHAYTMTLSAVGVNPTTITATMVDNTTSATVASISTTDSTAALQSLTSGVFGVFANSGSGSALIGSFTSYQYTAGAATTISVTAPTSGVAGSASSNFTLSVNGSLASAVTVTPASVNGATLTPSSVTFPANASPANQTFTVTESSAGSDTISFTNSGSLTNPSSVTYTATSAITILPNNAAFFYSPENWDVTSARALSANGGAYFRIMFSGASVAMNFNVANQGSPATEIYYRIDGYEAQSPFTRANVSSIITPTMPSDTSPFPWHLLEFTIKSTSGANNRWNTPSATAVWFTGLTLASGGTVMATGVAPNGEIIFYTDSIGEGVRTVNQSLANEPDDHDSMMGWAYQQRNLLGVEVGIIGWAGTGFLTTGNGNVPPLASTYNYMVQGVPRTFNRPNLKLVVVELATNDGSSGLTTAVTADINSLLAFYPSIPIVMMRAFNGANASAVQAGIAACSNPALVHWMDTTGFFNTAYGCDSTTLHPSGPNNLGIIAPKVAAALKPLLLGATSGAAIHATGARGGIR